MRLHSPVGRTVVVCVVLALASASCGVESARPPSFTTTDSSGVRVVTSRRPAWEVGGAWRIDSVPLRSVGGDEGDSLAMLQVVAGVMRQSDGRLVVADRGSSQVKYYGASGQLERVVGRPGRGPGEFEYIDWLLACGGDSAFVSDIGNRQVSVLAPDGALARRFSLSTSEPTGTPFSTACARNGAVVTTGWGDLRRALEQDRPFRPEVPVDLSFTAGGPVRHTLGRFPGTEMAPVQGGGSPRAGGRWLRVAIGRGAVWLAPNDGRGLLRFDTSGVLTLAARFGDGDPPLTAVDAELLKRLALDSIPTARERTQVERELSMHPFPDRLPQHFAILVDALDHLWVQRPPRALAPHPAWEVLSPDGVWLGAVELPRGTRPLEVGDNYLIGVRTAESGAEEIVEYTLRRR